MQRPVFESAMPVPASTLFAWHARPGAFERLAPPWMPMTLASFEGIRDGQRAVLRLGVPPLTLRWVARHEGYEEGRQFRDVMERGPFPHWRHTHRMVPDGPDASRLQDRLEYALPLNAVAEPLVGGVARTQIARQFAYRHRVTRADLEAHARYEGPPLTVAVSGSSGVIGTALRHFLTTGGHRVLRLVRRPSDAADAVYWNPRTGTVDAERLAEADAVVHLAGESVFGLRWSAAKKARIYHSRVAGTRLLSEALASLRDRPRTLVSASAIGYYGHRGDAVCTEADGPGRDFLAAVCRDWEAATAPAADAGVRVVRPRIGVVLTPQGGALLLMAPAFWLGLGGTAGNSGQWMSWVTLDDVVYGLHHALTTPALEGPANLVAPNPARMDAFAQTMGRVLHRPTPLHVPASVLRAVMGETADAFALKSIRAVPEALEGSGYAFRFPQLEGALRHVLGRSRAPFDA